MSTNSKPAYHCTQSAKEADIERRWYVVDATGQTLGRLATRVATILRGKHRVNFTPHVDGGDFVIIVNAEKVVFTGRKLDQKVYYRHTGHMGGVKEQTARQMLEGPYAERVLVQAIRGMLPKNSLGRKTITKLKVYTGPEHPHAAQKPEVLTLG